jgi:hypothetical protein
MVKGTLCLINPYLIDSLEMCFNYVLIIDLEHVRCLTTEESGAECAVLSRKGSKM